jgi:hypothetical protein
MTMGYGWESRTATLDTFTGAQSGCCALGPAS